MGALHVEHGVLYIGQGPGVGTGGLLNVLLVNLSFQPLLAAVSQRPKQLHFICGSVFDHIARDASGPARVTRRCLRVYMLRTNIPTRCLFSVRADGTAWCSLWRRCSIVFLTRCRCAPGKILFYDMHDA